MTVIRKHTAVGTMIIATFALTGPALAVLPAAAQPAGLVNIGGDKAMIADESNYGPKFGDEGLLNQTAGANVSEAALENGLILITSGRTGNASNCPGLSGPLADAEVYDPISGTYLSTSLMISGRYKHNQIRLDDGRVLVAGGVNGCITNKTGSSELFDPSTNQFTRTGSMSIGRSLFPMHKLPDGDVLVFGGEISRGFVETTDRIEKYDVSTGRWLTVGYLSQRKAGMGSCALADGTILLVGGHNRNNDNDPIRTKSAEIFDPATNTTRLLPTRTSFEHKRIVKGLTLQDGRCLIASEGIGIEAELFDPDTETFSIVPSLPGFEKTSTSSYFMNMLPDGTVLHVGSPSMIFDSTSNSFRLVPY